MKIESVNMRMLKLSGTFIITIVVGIAAVTPAKKRLKTLKEEKQDFMGFFPFRGEAFSFQYPCYLTEIQMTLQRSFCSATKQ